MKLSEKFIDNYNSKSYWKNKWYKVLIAIKNQ